MHFLIEEYTSSSFLSSKVFHGLAHFDTGFWLLALLSEVSEINPVSHVSSPPWIKSVCLGPFLCVKEQQQLGQYRRHFPQVLFQPLTIFTSWDFLTLFWFGSAHWNSSLSTCLISSATHESSFKTTVFSGKKISTSLLAASWRTT